MAGSAFFGYKILVSIGRPNKTCESPKGRPLSTPPPPSGSIEKETLGNLKKMFEILYVFELPVGNGEDPIIQGGLYIYIVMPVKLITSLPPALSVSRFI